MATGGHRFDHPAFAPYRRWLADGALPGLDALNDWARDRALALPDGRALRFVAGNAADALAYETAIRRDGHIHVRSGCWHDVFNALAWLAFPRTKAVLNARHVTDGASASGNRRSRGRDAATLLDESGLILVCADASLARLLREHAWRQLFVARRDDVAAAWRPVVIGHGVLQKLMTPFRAITASVLLLPEAPAAVRRDAAVDVAQLDVVAAALAGASSLQPRDLAALPVAALPGWDAEGLGERLFDDVAVFRPARATLPA